jgi:hypothetical protein
MLNRPTWRKKTEDGAATAVYWRGAEKRRPSTLCLDTGVGVST